MIAHDIGWRIPERLHDGTPTGVIRHENVVSCANALSRDSRGIHCIATPDATDVITFGRLVAFESLRRNGGNHGYPVIIFLDEVVAAGVCDPHHLSPDMKTLIATRRHENIGIIWTCQSARLVHNQLIGLSTEMVVFELSSRADYRKLEDCGIPEEEIAKIPSLPKYGCVEYKF